MSSPVLVEGGGEQAGREVVLPSHSLLTSCHGGALLPRKEGTPSILSPTPGPQVGTRERGTNTEPLGG